MSVSKIVALAVLAAALALGYLAYERYVERYTVAREEGLAVSKVVSATFSKTSALKVSELSGTVQSVASDTRGFGWLTSDRTIKVPYSVEYFVDLSGLSASDYNWDGKSRTLMIVAPDVRVGRGNIDESDTTFSRTRGIFVTRDAMEVLRQRTSLYARRAAQAEAGKPERLAQARDAARTALSTLFRGALSAAGLGDVTVRVRFANEVPGPNERWDTTRSISEVLANRE